MLRTVGDQPTLWEAILPEELRRLPEELARVDVLLDDAVFIAPFTPFFDPRIGRPSTPMETYLGEGVGLLRGCGSTPPWYGSNVSYPTDYGAVGEGGQPDRGDGAENTGCWWRGPHQAAGPLPRRRATGS